MKLIKKLLCLTYAVLLCFSLIGCNLIDEMRDAQIHFNEKANIIYNGCEYKLLPACEAFTPNITLNKNLYITDADLPVLLSELYGKRAYLSDDKKFIQTTDEYYTNEYYASTDVYENIATRINAGNYFDGYCFYYNYYDENDDIPSYKQKHQFLTDGIQLAIDQVIAGDELKDIDVSLLYQFEVMSIYAASKDLLFKKYAFSIYKTENFIYLADIMNDDRVYKVSDEYTEVFESLINEYNLKYQSPDWVLPKD